ncbi:MAG TPA: acylphosphatase [Candidatus Acidoferrum sp.]
MENEDLQARRFVVTGRVQGVGYRYFVEHAAGQLGVKGYVRNRRDGSVEILAMGTPGALAALREALHDGPMMARVTNVSEEPEGIDSRYAAGFSIEMTL